MIFSILIANYNNERYIKQCIESAIGQINNGEYRFEIIVCDDASTDNSQKIISLFCCPILSFLKNDKNRGVGFTKKKLIDASTGDYFIFLDSDDFLDNHALQTLYETINSLDTTPSVIYTDSRTINQVGHVLSSGGRSKKIINNLLDESFSYPIFHLIAYNRTSYNKTEGANIFLKVAFDFDLWYKMEEVGEIHFLDRVLYNYRKNEWGISQTKHDIQKKVAIFLWHNVVIYEACKRRNIDFNPFNRKVSEIIISNILDSTKGILDSTKGNKNIIVKIFKWLNLRRL